MTFEVGRSAARVPGLASGLALAVRPAGLAEAPGSTARRRRVPRSGMRSTVEAGGASPDNARRSVPVAVTFFRRSAHSGARLTAWPWCWRARQRDTAGTAGGRSPGCRARQPPRRRTCVRRTRRKAAAPQRRDPRVNPGRLRRVTLAALPSRLLAPVLAVHGLGRQARRAEGAPLKTVEKVVTTRPMALVRSPDPLASGCE